MKRRDLLAGGLAAGATFALSARAGAQDAPRSFAEAFGLEPVPAVPEAPLPPPLPITAPPDPAYDARLVEIARRELSRAGARVWRHDIVGVADFARPSTLPRLHFINLENGTIRAFHVAHGRGSDPAHSGFLQTFSNLPGSEATSRGGYLTCEWYKGKYGTSIRLEGMDQDNSNALDRAIVMHPAEYARPEHIAKWGRLGRSEGCFAMSPDNFNEALWHLSGGRLLFADRVAAS